MGQDGGGAAVDKRADRLATIRLRFGINSTLDDMGITAIADVGRAVGLPAAEAQKLLHRRRWREGDVAALRRAAERLGLVEDPQSGHWHPVPFMEAGRDQPEPQERDWQ